MTCPQKIPAANAGHHDIQNQGDRLDRLSNQAA
jgi:hypothetical protein